MTGDDSLLWDVLIIWSLLMMLGLLVAMILDARDGR